jgi:hypothetical protein
MLPLDLLKVLFVEAGLFRAAADGVSEVTNGRPPRIAGYVTVTRLLLDYCHISAACTGPP